MSLTFGSLFAGIGGLDLGLERAGLRCRWQVELDGFASQVLQRHWPDVPKHRDVHGVGAHNLQRVNLICGGFPCQDISNAGKRQGIEGPRSSLWGEFSRIVCELRPRYVLVENVAALRARGLGRVLGDLAAGGFDAEWDCIPAASLGAPHQRDRLFVLAYAHGQRRPEQRRPGAAPSALASPECGGAPPPDLQSRRFFGTPPERSRWAAEPQVGRLADGFPSRVAELRGLGNAVVPQVAEHLGRRLLAFHAAR